MHDSIVGDNNLVYNPEEGINVWGSPDNEIYNNTIHNVSIAFYLSNPSSSNIGVTTGNKTKCVQEQCGKCRVWSGIFRHREDNVFSKNTFVKTRSHKFYLWRGSEMEVEDQAFINFTG
jgi:parallel beta-helix repeat protein